ncbi:putative mitotubule-associated protein Gb4 [Trypanosoma conorhini]|uniref:Putative mitotubule-associated protein Gb4 n=1 Tax=Trypanosoma conorhini TaxID=83891 RepID=A0A422P8A0_9TRYP|nr:putative mitotubule-associated protein Gb4 [Trypanosoma conorhini]RNF13931.1 putative mitotubule-associated protein Gb4 [Trypanosoma conorhini]
MPGEVRERVRETRESGVAARRLRAEGAPPNGPRAARPGPTGTEVVALKDAREDGEVVMVQRSSSVTSAMGRRTSHALHFRGHKWSSVLKKHRAALEAAVVADIVEATGLDARRIENITLAFTDVLVVTFTVRPQDHPDAIADVHVALQTCNFPRTTALYRNYRSLQK